MSFCWSHIRTIYYYNATCSTLIYFDYHYIIDAAKKILAEKMSSSTNAICTFEALSSFYSLLDWSDSPHLGQQLRPELGIPPQEILNFGGAEKRDIT